MSSLVSELIQGSPFLQQKEVCGDEERETEAETEGREMGKERIRILASALIPLS